MIEKEEAVGMAHVQLKKILDHHKKNVKEKFILGLQIVYPFNQHHKMH